MRNWIRRILGIDSIDKTINEISSTTQNKLEDISKLLISNTETHSKLENISKLLENNNKKINYIMIYNIAVFGSCASRDNFYSGINPDYKKYFNCSISSQRGSIISLMQEPVSFKNQDIQILPENRVNKAGTQFINQDLTKNFLAEVKKFKPDYILIDNYFV